MSHLRYDRRADPAGHRRPSIARIHRLSTAGLVIVAGVAVLMLGIGLFELVHLLIARMMESPTTPRLVPTAVESLIRVTQLM